MTLVELARKLRPIIEKAAMQLEDADAIEGVQLFPAWSAEAAYLVGDRVRYNNILYKCIQNHAAQESWTPEAAPSLWARVLIPDPDVIPEWIQPDSTNPYQIGDKVILIPNSVDEKYLKDFENKRCARKDLGNNYAIHSTFRSSSSDGFLKQFYVAEPDLLVKYDAKIPANLAVFSELLSVAVAGLRRIDFKETNHVAIFGDGILAYITYIVFKHDHPDTKLTIYGIDRNKLSMFKDCQARTYDEYQGEKYDTMIEIVGGKYSADAINKMIDWATVGADLILMGVSEEKVPLNTRLVLEKGLSLKGVTRSDNKDFEHVAKLLEDKTVQERILPMVISEITINSVNDIYKAYTKDIENKTVIGKNIMKW